MLISDNGALMLDPPEPTYDPNTSEESRQQRIVESPHRNGTYVDASMPPLYTTAGVEVSLSRPNSERPTDSFSRLAAFCMQSAHIERCYALRDAKRKKDKFVALQLYQTLRRLNLWPSRG